MFHALGPPRPWYGGVGGGVGVVVVGDGRLGFCFFVLAMMRMMWCGRLRFIDYLMQGQR